MKEIELQIATATLLDTMGLLWCHPPNGAFYGGGGASARRGAILRRQGLKSGVPDVVIFTPSPLNNQASFVELKTKVGRLSPLQRQWRDDLIEMGYNWGLARDLDQVTGLLTEWGYRD